MVFSFGLESILKQETVKRPDGKQHGITSKPGISNLDHLEATAGIVVSQEGHFSLYKYYKKAQYFLNVHIYHHYHHIIQKQKQQIIYIFIWLVFNILTVHIQYDSNFRFVISVAKYYAQIGFWMCLRWKIDTAVTESRFVVYQHCLFRQFDQSLVRCPSFDTFYNYMLAMKGCKLSIGADDKDGAAQMMQTC